MTVALQSLRRPSGIEMSRRRKVVDGTLQPGILGYDAREHLIAPENTLFMSLPRQEILGGSESLAVKGDLL